MRIMLQNILEYVRSKYHPLWQLRQTPWFKAFQKAVDFPVYTYMPQTGIKVAVKALRDTSLRYGPEVLEPEITIVFDNVVRLTAPKVFWDVGANVGFYSWYMLAHCNGIQVTMFEPDIDNFGLIQKTIKKNYLSKVVPQNVAVSDKTGEVEFLVDAVSGATGVLSDVRTTSNAAHLHRRYGLSRVVCIQAVTLDSQIAAGTIPPDIIKIDVEGAEHLVLKGAIQLLREFTPLIIMETEQENVVSLLEAMHYTVLNIDVGNVLCIPFRLRALQSQLLTQHST